MDVRDDCSVEALGAIAGDVGEYPSDEWSVRFDACSRLEEDAVRPRANLQRGVEAKSERGVDVLRRELLLELGLLGGLRGS